MTGRFIHSSKAGVDVSAVPVRFCCVPSNSGVDVTSKVSVATGSVDSFVLVAVLIELRYLGVGILCSSVSVGVDVRVGMTFDSAPQADIKIETSKVKMMIRFIVIGKCMRVRLGAWLAVASKNLMVWILSLFS